MLTRDQSSQNAPRGSATLPFVDSRIYTDPRIFQEELQTIWRNTWVIAMHESELPAPLDFRTTTTAGEPIIVVRGDDGRVRAFLNVCPHRGALLLREPAGTLKLANPSGSPNRISCMFHSWQFDPEGRCVSIPRRKAGYQERLECADVSLRAVACEVAFGGLVWLNLAAEPGSLSDYIGGAFAELAPHLESEPLEVFHHHKAIVRTNYKLWHDTNSEFYHDYMHHFNRVTSMQQPGYFARHYDTFASGHVTLSSMTVAYKAYEHGQTALATDRDLSFPGLQQNGWKLLDLFPGATLNLRGSVLRLDTVTPLACDRTLIEFRGLGLRRDTLQERQQRVRDHNTIWGPFGRNLPEDLLGVTNQGLGMRRDSEALHVLHGRFEDNAIHDEVGMRHYYTEWSRRMGRLASAPFADVDVAKTTREVSPSVTSDAE
jgi:methanesulfonate monooxygenase large subunit